MPVVGIFLLHVYEASTAEGEFNHRLGPPEVLRYTHLNLYDHISRNCPVQLNRQSSFQPGK